MRPFRKFRLREVAIFVLVQKFDGRIPLDFHILLGRECWVRFLSWEYRVGVARPRTVYKWVQFLFDLKTLLTSLQIDSVLLELKSPSKCFLSEALRVRWPFFRMSNQILPEIQPLQPSFFLARWSNEEIICKLDSNIWNFLISFVFANFYKKLPN